MMQLRCAGSSLCSQGDYFLLFFSKCRSFIEVKLVSVFKKTFVVVWLIIPLPVNTENMTCARPLEIKTLL